MRSPTAVPAKRPSFRERHGRSRIDQDTGEDGLDGPAKLLARGGIHATARAFKSARPRRKSLAETQCLAQVITTCRSQGTRSLAAQQMNKPRRASIPCPSGIANLGHGEGGEMVPMARSLALIAKAQPLGSQCLDDQPGAKFRESIGQTGQPFAADFQDVARREGLRKQNLITSIVRLENDQRPLLAAVPGQQHGTVGIAIEKERLDWRNRRESFLHIWQWNGFVVAQSGITKGALRGKGMFHPAIGLRADVMDDDRASLAGKMADEVEMHPPAFEIRDKTPAWIIITQIRERIRVPTQPGKPDENVATGAAGLGTR